MADERDEQEQSGFTVRDRRRFRQDVAEDSADAAPVPASSPAALAVPAPPSPSFTEPVLTDEEQAMFGETAFPDDSPAGMPGEEQTNELPDIYSVVALFLGEMRSHAILRMGLAPNPMTGESERDLTQAKIAIDTAVFLGAQLESVLPGEEKLPLRAMLSELQMLYVEQTKNG